MKDSVSALYDAAVGEESWEDALAAVAADTGAGTLVLGVGNPRLPDDVEIWTFGWDHAPVQDAGYALGDVWNPTINPGVAAGLIMPVGRSAHVREYVPEATLATSDFIQSSVVPNRVPDNHLFVPLREADYLSGGFFAKGNNADFDGAEVAAIDRAVPHIGRALKLRAQLARHRSTERNLAALFEHLAYGVMLLDRHGEVIVMNARCEALIARNDGVSVTRRRPYLGSPAAAAIAAALKVVDLSADAFPSVRGVPIPRSGDRPPYLARIYPGIGFAALSHAAAVRAVVLIDDPLDPEIRPDLSLLSELFSLSPAESAVARLLPRVQKRRALADLLGLSENTVKTHLASIREKIGARSTAEMVRILTRLARDPSTRHH